MECKIESKKNISREPETRMWPPEPDRKEACTFFNGTAKLSLIFSPGLYIILVLKYLSNFPTYSHSLCVISLENTLVIDGAGQVNSLETVEGHFCKNPNFFCWYRLYFRGIFAFLAIVLWDYFEKRSLSLQHVIVLKEESNMGMQMKFNFACEEHVRLLATLDEETLIKVVELMARMIVRVQEKKKEEKHV